MGHQRSSTLLLIGLLAGAVLAVYGQVYRHGFVEYDDPAYVSQNRVVQRGLTMDGMRWAFTTGHMGNWNPVTWLSHMLDVQLFGLNPGAHHLVNVALHLANTLLLFAVLRRMTREPGPSLIVAALFALHPLHVESVAWISERKDVLSTLFWFLTLWAYARYVAVRAARWYGAMLVFFALGLMAKPMLVTVPFVLLLLDFWPLRRGFGFRVPGSWSFAEHQQVGTKTRKPGRKNHDPGTRNQEPFARLLVEKLPLFGLTAAFSVVAYIMQIESGAVAKTDALPIGIRVANALVAYVRYLVMAVWPADLAVLYPYETRLPPWQIVGATFCLAGISLLVLRVARRYPYVLTGWLWYLGTLVPVIGLVQIGNQALADRYTYVPLIGVFVMLVWGGRDLVTRWALPLPAVLLVVGSVISACAVTAWAQVGLWRTSEALFSHTLRVTRANCIAHNNLGVALATEGRTEEALAHFQEALRIKPDYVDAHNNLGNALRDTGRLAEAIAHYEHAGRLNPDFADAHYNLGIALAAAGRVEEAIGQYQYALRLNPDNVDAHNNLGNALADAGRFPEAIAQYEEALRLQPDFARAHYNLGLALAQSGRLPDAIGRYHRALELEPDYAYAHYNLGIALTEADQFDAAITELREALRLNAQFPDAEYKLGIALTEAARFDEAIAHFRQALQLRPEYAEAHNDLGVALVSTGHIDEAIGHFERALRLNPDLPDAQYNLEVARAMRSAADGQ